MENIDDFVKSQLSSRTALPSEDGWNTVKEKMKRKKRKRRFLVFFLFGLVLFFMIYVNTGILSKETSYIKKTEQQTNHTVVDSSSNLNSNEINLKKQITKNTTDTLSQSILAEKNKTYTKEVTSTVTKTVIPVETRKERTNATLVESNQKKTNQHETISSQNNKTKKEETTMLSIHSREIYKNTPQNSNSSLAKLFMEGKNVKPYDYQLTYDLLADTRKKEAETNVKKQEKNNFTDNLLFTVGINGLLDVKENRPFKSYYAEVAFLLEDKLKNNFQLQYGASLSYRNLHFQDSISTSNEAELNLNIITNIEKKVGNYGVQVGAYVGYEIFSPNDGVINDNNTFSFFKRKFNYGLSTSLRYKKIGLVFKYELSPYYNDIRIKENNRFIIGISYDF